MAAHHVYTQPVTDYFTAIPMKYEQKILGLLKNICGQVLERATFQVYDIS